MDNFNLDFEIDEEEIQKELDKREPIYEVSDEDILEAQPVPGGASLPLAGTKGKT